MKNKLKVDNKKPMNRLDKNMTLSTTLPTRGRSGDQNGILRRFNSVSDHHFYLSEPPEGSKYLPLTKNKFAIVDENDLKNNRGTRAQSASVSVCLARSPEREWPSSKGEKAKGASVVGRPLSTRSEAIELGMELFSFALTFFEIILPLYRTLSIRFRFRFFRFLISLRHFLGRTSGVHYDKTAWRRFHHQLKGVRYAS